MSDDARTVYSSRDGRVCRSCGLPVRRCACRASPRALRRDAGPTTDRVARMRRETRRGKSVIAIRDLPLADAPLRELARELKRRCATGGSAKDGVIEIQGDHRDVLRAELEARGYTVKWSGG